MACLGAVVSASIVAWINIDHGYALALTAALKQAFYAFFATGLILQFCRWLAARPVLPLVAASTAVVIPLLITMSLLFVVHSLKGTPEPFYSIIPGTVLSLIGLTLITYKTVSAAASTTAPTDPARKSTTEDS
jgi:hypothetical protein